MMGARYAVVYYTWTEDSPLKNFREGELSRICVVDTQFKNQIVVTFHIKECKRIGYNPDWYGVNINDARQAKIMATRLCRQMNRECGYAIIGEIKND